MSPVLPRRDFLGAATIAAAGVWPTRGANVEPDTARRMVVFYDGRQHAGRRFAARIGRSAWQAIDIAPPGALRAVARRDFLVPRQHVAIGLTEWADWVVLRSILAEAGLRPRREIRIDGRHPPMQDILAELLLPPTDRLVRSRISQAASAPTVFGWAAS